MPTKGHNGVGDVGMSGEHGIHERPYGTLIHFNVDFRGGEFGKVLIRENGSGNGVSFEHAIPFKHILYILLLQESNPAYIVVSYDLNAKDPEGLP